MAKVKGSKQQKMIVVAHQPVYSWCIRVAFVIFALGISTGFYYYGFSEGVDVNNDARADRDNLLEDVSYLEGELTVVRQLLVNSEQSSTVDRQALNEVQGTIVSLREHIMQLEEDVLFYKEIMDPDNDERGLIIGLFDLFESDLGPDNFRYRLELRQLGDNQTFVNGYANINLLGLEEGQERSLPLRSVSSNVNELDIRLRFQYFQNIEGELTLPEGFEPDRVQILAIAEGAEEKTVQRTFGWVVQEN